MPPPQAGEVKSVRGASALLPIQSVKQPSVIGPCFCQAAGPPVFFFPWDKPEGAERRQAHQQFHACEAWRASCAVDKFTQSAQTSTRHARLSALHRGDFGRRDCSDDTRTDLSAS